MAIKDDMEDIQEAVINELITENGITNTLADGQVIEAKIAANAVTTAKIADGSVTTAKLGGDVDLDLADNEVTTAKINNGAVTLAKLGGDVDLGQVNDGAVTTAKIADDAVTPAKLDREYLESTGGNVTIDSSGHLLVGKSSSSHSIAGGAIFNDGRVYSTADGQFTFTANRLSSDGEIIRIQKDTTTVGSIFTSGGIQMGIGTGDTGILFAANADAWLPWNTDNTQRDNAIDLGRSATRFDDIYATNSSIQTSDANEKQDIEALSEAEQRVAVACKGLLRKFRWKSSVEEKGDEARIHFGIIAQDLKAAFEAEGLDAGRYAMFISSTWTDEDTSEEKTRLGVRYPELLAFIIAAL